MNDHDRMIRIDERVGQIHTAVYGSDSQKGILNRVIDLEAWRNRTIGALGVITLVIAIIIGVK